MLHLGSLPSNDRDGEQESKPLVRFHIEPAQDKDEIVIEARASQQMSHPFQVSHACGIDRFTQ